MIVMNKWYINIDENLRSIYVYYRRRVSHLLIAMVDARPRNVDSLQALSTYRIAIVNEKHIRKIWKWINFFSGKVLFNDITLNTNEVGMRSAVAAACPFEIQFLKLICNSIHVRSLWTTYCKEIRVDDVQLSLHGAALGGG